MPFHAHARCATHRHLLPSTTAERQVELISRCWHEDAEYRPPFTDVTKYIDRAKDYMDIKQAVDTSKPYDASNDPEGKEKPQLSGKLSEKNSRTESVVEEDEEDAEADGE